ncbi:MAG: hypothetical protein FWH26_07030 [Oscillospiraceae bacterium]|nr:hypothetical protein [Oscillospiraceae bacterium]
MKKLLCAFLAVCMLSAVFMLPAAAAPPDPYAPIITKAPSFPAVVYVGDTIRWEVEAALPDGVEGEMSYAWYNYGSTRGAYGLIATGPKLELDIINEMREGYSRPTMRITIVVTNTYTDEFGEEKTASTTIESEEMSLELRMAWWEKLFAILFWGVPFVLFILLGGIASSPFRIFS